jgi:hypothetical protein
MYLFENVDAEWYFLIDDDTYMFLENIQEYLLTLDHNEAHYLGNPNSFVGCDGVTQFGQGPQFAHGGSGIILSRGALEKMKSVASECIQKYSSCWAGDIRLALCLRDVNVFVQGTGRNHINPPNDLHFWGSPCDKPFTFHHLTVPQIQKLYQSDQRNQVTRNQDIVPLFLEQKLEMNVDRKGYDYYNFEVIEPQSCFEKCAEDEHCVAFTHANKRCYLKDKIPDASDVEGFVSGPLISHYKCT